MLIVVCILLPFLHSSLCVDLTYNVEEEKSPGTYVGDIAADSYLFDTVLSEAVSVMTFSQLQREETQLFNVTATGKLYTAQTLDSEYLCTFNKECFKIVKVAVRKAKAFMKIIKIKVIIEDINDHPPEFPINHVNLQFSETDGKDTERSIPNAIDKDVGYQNHLIEYYLTKKEPFSLSVSKRADGISALKIVLEKKLDREVKDTYMVQVVAKDGGFPPRQSVLNVQISVKDENDNPPVFSQSIYNISMKSTHQKHIPIVTLSAKDSDIDKNKKVSYCFSPMTSDITRSHFEVNQITGEIFVTEISSLDEKLTYKLFIEARDGGSPPLSSIATVLVNVINQQNNPPGIDIDFVSALNKKTATISEDIEVGSFIAYVMVTDNDIGQNGEVTCDLKHEKFKLLSMDSKEYKIVMKTSVDREMEEHYDITITCQDKGFPSLKRERRFSIQVMDINDISPQFTKDTFKFLTYENKKRNFPIGFINATDLDLGPGGQLTYSLKSNNKNVLPFQITDYGYISTTQLLDREQQDIYKFQVFVKDNGTPSLNNTANVIVEVLDENDNAPYFTFPSVNPFSLDVHYHPQSKNDISVLRASDRDSQRNAFLKYEILGGNDKQLFTVNSYTGMLSFSRKVYQNDAGTFDLQVVVKDSGTPVLSATTTLSLTLTVSNKTSTMLPAVDIQSDNMINVTLVIIIVAAAVIVSVAIVISITLCVVRYNNNRNNPTTPVQNPPYQTRNEMRQLIYQTNNPAGMNPEEMLNRNTQSMKSSSQFCPEEGSEKEWETSSTVRTLPKYSRKYSQPIEVTSCGEHMEQDIVMAPNYLSDTLTTQRDSGHGWSEGNTGHYEEIPGMSGLYGTPHKISHTSERQPYKDIYMKQL